MSDHSFAEIDVPRAAGAVENGFEAECFDAEAVHKRYGIDPAKHCWAEVANSGALYKQLGAYLGKHGTQQRSFAPTVGTKPMSKVDEMLADDEPARTIILNCGLGLITLSHALEGGRKVSVKALHQRRGPIVGGRCGAETWENLVVFVEGADNKEALQSFLEAVVNSEAEASPNEYTIYRWQVEHEYWKHAATKTSRSVDSVVLPSAAKEKIIEDLDAFLSRDTFEFYTNHGIPYKRSYLFYGVPGAGKTSLLTAIAGKYRRNLCIMQPTDPRFTDDALAEAIKEAPSRSIIVLEDVDALFDKNREAKNAKMTISFSGLLNALDGIGNPDGQIFVLTTNFRDNLDAALIRNGRVDMHLEFSHATEEQMEKLFSQFYPAPDDASLAGTFREAVVKALAGKPVNMAAMQHFFIRHMRKSALEAVAAVQSILDDLSEKASSDASSSNPADNKDTKDEEKEDKGEENTQQSTNTAAAPQQRFDNKIEGTNNAVHIHVYNAPPPVPAAAAAAAEGVKTS